MSLADTLETVLKNELAKRNTGEQILQKAAEFDQLVKRGMVVPDQYKVAPISPLPLSSQTLKFS